MSLDTLLTSSVLAKDLSKLDLVPDLLLNDLELEAVRWVRAYQARHGTTPELKRLEGEPLTRLYVNQAMVGAPLTDQLDMTLEYLKHRRLQRLLARLEAEHLAGGRYDLQALRDEVLLLDTVHADQRPGLKDLNRDRLYSAELLDQALEYGWASLDRYVGGILPGEVHALVAPLGTGKSMVVCQLAVRWARQGHRVLVVPGEMTPEQMLARLDGILGGFNPIVFRDKTRVEEFPALRARVQLELRQLLGDILFPRQRLTDISSLWTDVKQQGATAVIIDGLYLLPGKGGDKKWETVTNNSNSIKDGALTHDIPILETSQLVRGAGAPGTAITTDDIGYALAIGQDADVVVAGVLPVGIPSGMAMTVIKNRYGEQGGGAVVEWDWATMSANEVVGTKVLIGSAKP